MNFYEALKRRHHAGSRHDFTAVSLPRSDICSQRPDGSIKRTRIPSPSAFRCTTPYIKCCSCSMQTSEISTGRAMESFAPICGEKTKKAQGYNCTCVHWYEDSDCSYQSDGSCCNENNDDWRGKRAWQLLGSFSRSRLHRPNNI